MERSKTPSTTPAESPNTPSLQVPPLCLPPARLSSPPHHIAPAPIAGPISAEERAGAAADRPLSAAGPGVRLDSKHSHLILVDDGSGEFGREIEFRGLFEAHVRQARGAGDEAFIVETMRDLGIGWEGSTQAPPPAHPHPPSVKSQPRVEYIKPGT
jgi:hypothetical protein